MTTLTPAQKSALITLLTALIDQENAYVLVAPQKAASGFWFGGGNLVQDDAGVIWLSGRYRNFGDSRTGLQAGERGLECAIFRSDDGGQSFTKVAAWSKAELSRPGRKVLSIEGTALHRTVAGGWELFISSEKEMAYPAPLSDYQKPGTGVWTIDCMRGASPNAFDPATLTSVLENQTRPEYLHIKDPVVFDDAGNTAMVFCSHPFTWSSSNSGLALRPADDQDFSVQAWEIVSRGPPGM